MFQEIEGGTVSLTDGYEVYARPTIFHQQRQIIIELTFCNVFEGHCPCEDAKDELQRLLRHTDDKRFIVHRIEEEHSEKTEENNPKDI